MESIVWFFLFWAAVALLAAAVTGLALLTLRRQHEKLRRGASGKESYLSYAIPDYAKTAGFCVENCPRTELLTPTAYWLVDGRIAQIVYDLVPAQQLTLRAALHSDEGLLCGELCRDIDYTSDTVCSVDGVQVTLRQTNDGSAAAAWSRDGVDYLLYGEGLQMNAIGGLLPTFIAGTAVRRAG